MLLFDVVFCVQLAVSLDWKIDGGRILVAGTLIFLAAFGNYLGNLRPNYFAGIRTPWTLENPETWRATHRLGGRLIFFGSLVLLPLQFFLNAHAFGLIFVGSILLFAGWGIFYSWYHFRTQVARR